MTKGLSTDILLHSIGVIHTPHKVPEGTPIQPKFAERVQGTVLLFDDFADALADLCGFERVWLIYYMDRVRSWTARVKPFRDTVERGLFATRAPARPNPIGMSAVRLLSIVDRTLHVEGADMLDGSPLLDIKPYVPAFDAHSESRAGWFDSSTIERSLADGRFR